jgi:lipid-A-disaccharide synthase-like uncharacterized protein
MTFEMIGIHLLTYFLTSIHITSINRFVQLVQADVHTKDVLNQSFYYFILRLALLLLVKTFAQKDTMVVIKQENSLLIIVNVEKLERSKEDLVLSSSNNNKQMFVSFVHCFTGMTSPFQITPCPYHHRFHPLVHLL